MASQNIQIKPAPTGSAAIWSAADDSYAPNALIGYIAQCDFPEGQWIAMLLDLDDVMHDPQPIKRWVDASSAEHAEALVRAHYSRWVAKQD